MDLKHRQERLMFQMKRMGLTHFHVTTGPEWPNITPEERMTELENIFNAIENGDHMEVKNIDGPSWFPMPQYPIEAIGTWKWKVHNTAHKMAWKFDKWLQWRIWKVKRLGERHGLLNRR